MPSRTEVQHVFMASRASLGLVVAFSFCVNLLVLAVPIYLLQLYERVLASRSVDTLVMLTGMVVVALAVLTILDAFRREMLARIGNWLDERLQPTVLSAAFRCALRDDAAAAVQAWRDLAALRSFFGGSGIVAALDAPWAPLFLVVLFLLHPVLGMIGTAGAAFLLSLAVLNEALTRASIARAGAASIRGNHRLEAILRNAEVTAAMGMLEGAARLLRRDYAEAKEEQSSARRRSGAILGFSRFGRQTVQILIMASAAWMVLWADVSPGAIFAAALLLNRALGPFENSIGSWQSFVAARLAYRRLTSILATMPRGRERMPLPRPAGALTLERVTFVPPGTDTPALNRITLRLAPGEVLGVTGPSGAGKSTLARLVAGIWMPTMGHVRLDEANISVWLKSGGARYVGYLPQDIELFEGSVKDNITRFADVGPDQVIETARLVGLHEMIMRLPRAYDTNIGEGGARLSGGQRQRLGLARAFFGAPCLVVLDEPNASLDQEGEQALISAIEQLRATGTTIVITAHRPHILRIANKLLVLRNGTVNAFGAPETVIAKLSSRRSGNLANARPPVVEGKSA
jgi:PrtD family type I secretion system ABC transporter